MYKRQGSDGLVASSDRFSFTPAILQSSVNSLCKVILEAYRGAMLEEMSQTLALGFCPDFDALLGKKLPSHRTLGSFGGHENAFKRELKLIVLSQPVFKNSLKPTVSLFPQ